MKEITLKFIGTGYKNMYQVKIKLYDLNDNLVYEGTTYNGKINICLRFNCYYKLKIYTCNETVNNVLYVNKNNDIYTYILNRAYMKKITTFILKDYNYNLPIEKGEIILWQK